MSCFNISQEKLNNASYEDLSWLMESIHNTYKIKGCAWEKADKEYLQAKCEEWELSPKGKKDDLIVALQQAQTDYEYAQLYSTKPNTKPKKEKAEKPKKEKVETKKEKVETKKEKAEKPKKEKVETKVETKQKTKKSDDESVPEWAKGKTVADLKGICKEKQIKGASGKNKAQIIKLIEEAGKAAKEEPPKEESSSDSDSDSDSDSESETEEPKEEPEASDEEEEEEEEEEPEASDEEVKKRLKKLKKAMKMGVSMPCMDTLPQSFWEGKWMDGEGTGTIRFVEDGAVIGTVGNKEDPEMPWIKKGLYKAEDYELSDVSDSESDSDSDSDDDSEDDDKKGDWEYDEDNEQWVHSVTGQIKWCDEKPE